MCLCVHVCVCRADVYTGARKENGTLREKIFVLACINECLCNTFLQKILFHFVSSGTIIYQGLLFYIIFLLFYFLIYEGLRNF